MNIYEINDVVFCYMGLDWFNRPFWQAQGRYLQKYDVRKVTSCKYQIYLRDDEPAVIVSNLEEVANWIHMREET